MNELAASPAGAPSASAATAPRHTVFFVSDGTGITAETFGNSILSQFAIKPRHLRRPFIDTPDKAHQVVREINHTAEHDGRKPIVFITLVRLVCIYNAVHAFITFAIDHVLVDAEA